MTRDVPVALATKHHKNRQIQPAFSELLGWELVVSELDTDAFGTFTGDIGRELSARDTVLAKARAGAVQLGLSRGVASEGTIGPHPDLPFLGVDQELIAFVDLEEGLEIVESVTSTNVHVFSEEWFEGLSLEGIADRADLPRHALIVRTIGNRVRPIAKGIKSSVELQRAINEGLAQHPGAKLQIETDHRAMMSPSRQAVIEQCAWKIATRLSTLCPSCSGRGWGMVGYEFGVPCRDCGLPSARVARAEIRGCARCQHTVAVPREIARIDPDQCLACNP